MTREETKKRFKSWCQEHIGNNASDEDYHMFNNIMALLEQEPCCEQIKWERDTAIAQLKELGYGLGEKPKTDVLDKIRTEITDTLYVDSLIFGELIGYREGRIRTDDVIEEFNRVTKAEILKIIDKYKAESEEKE